MTTRPTHTRTSEKTLTEPCGLYVVEVMVATSLASLPFWRDEPAAVFGACLQPIRRSQVSKAATRVAVTITCIMDIAVSVRLPALPT